MKKITPWIVGTAVVIVLVWDIIAQVAEGTASTVSAMVWKLSDDNPLLAVAMGYIVGHLFSPKKQPSFSPWLWWLAAILSVAIIGIEIAFQVGSGHDLITTLRNPDLSFVRLIIGLGLGMWFWRRRL